MIKIKGMNWNTGNGFYEYEQYYTAYANQNYCRSKVHFNKFFPTRDGVLMGCGMRKKPQEDNFIQKGGIIISSGPEEVRDPEKIPIYSILRREPYFPRNARRGQHVRIHGLHGLE